MRNHNLSWLRWNLVLVAFAMFPLLVRAQFFIPPGNGDLLAGFRKTGAHQGTNELVVSLGNITNLLNVPMHSTITLSNVASARLTDAFSSDYTFLQWSVFGANYNLSTPWTTSLGAFPESTVWYTLPRTNSSTPAAPHNRYSKNNQTSLGTSMVSIGNGANTISGQLAGGTNANNNTILVREPFVQAYSQFYLTAFMGDFYDSTKGDLGGQVFTFSIEQKTPSPFTSSVRSDLYQSAPAPGTFPPKTYVDPITGDTTNVYYVGYFDLSPDGVLTFTRDTAGTVTPPPPPPPLLSALRQGTTTTISFGTTNGATYTLYYTGASGLGAPVSSWSTLPGTVTGDGSTKSFTDTSTDPARFYRVGAH